MGADLKVCSCSSGPDGNLDTSAGTAACAANGVRHSLPRGGFHHSGTVADGFRHVVPVGQNDQRVDLGFTPGRVGGMQTNQTLTCRLSGTTKECSCLGTTVPQSRLLLDDRRPSATTTCRPISSTVGRPVTPAPPPIFDPFRRSGHTLGTNSAP